MSVYMLGVDHNTAGLDIRSKFSLTNKNKEKAYELIKSIPEIRGCVILSTCNRMEWWLSIEEESDYDPSEAFFSFLNLEKDLYKKYVYEKNGDEAIEHIFRLASGLESQIIGEGQILTQLVESLQGARLAYATDHTLEVLFRLSITAGKRVRTETDLSSADNSIIHTALNSLKEKGVSVSGKKCLVIGNGMMGRLSASALLERDAEVTVTVRQYRSGVVDIPKGCRRIDYSERYNVLPEYDLIVSATSSPNLTLKHEDIKKLVIEHPIIMIDLAVPRDIDPDISEIPDMKLFDIDDFFIDRRSEKLKNNILKAEGILKEESDIFREWYEGRDIVALISDIKEKSSKDLSIRMKKVFKKLPMDDREKEALNREIEGAAMRMMNKLLFGMRSRLSDETFSECMDVMKKIYRT
ncbi:MAG: glutamyl-tRNA reductase [Lachnospiraceae bacterium]|nr:glutamyl-tRNA reductase [Lachnospiraceae bacterium]